MSYTVLITVTNCQTDKPIKGATVYDGTTSLSTNAAGQCDFEVMSDEGDPDLPDQVQISANEYGPQYTILEPDDPAVSICLQPYPNPQTTGQPTKPVVRVVANEPATLQAGGSITVSWVSSQYDKFLIWWTVDGEPLAQGEDKNSGTSGSWTTNQAVYPGATYTFAVEGGTSSGPLTGYNYSGWGNTVTVQAAQNLRSLRQFLLLSGINPSGLHVRSIMGGLTSLKAVMKLA